MPGHWVLFTFHAWGHLRPESNLAVTLARKFPDVTITCIVDGDFAKRSMDEMKRNVTLGHDEEVLSRIRQISLARANARMTPQVMAIFSSPLFDPRRAWATGPEDIATIHAAFDAMMEERPFDDISGTTWEPIQKPNLIITDMFMGRVVPAIKQKYDLPLYMWFVGSAAALTRGLGPTENGGRAPTYVKECHAIEADPEKSQGKPFATIAQEVFTSSASFPDDIVRVKGLPPMYQWEDVPQTTWDPMFYESIAAGYPLFQMTDGVFLPTVHDIESEGVEGVLDWYSSDVKREVLCLGPQLPPDLFTPMSGKKGSQMAGHEVAYEQPKPGQEAVKSTAEGDPCMVFLDEALQNHGVRSAIYVSFGATYFPQPRHVEILFERIMALEKTMPFIFTTAAPKAFLSDELAAKIKESGRGLVVPWAPQQAILAHPALGQIVSHCGGGGTFESLSQGVPVIGWPFIWDQPPHAVWMSQVLDTGFELLQVRSGPVKGKAMRGGPDGTEITGTDEAIAKEMDEVLLACQGDEGNRKRANAEKVKQLIWDAHQPGGQIDKHLNTLKVFASA